MIKDKKTLAIKWLRRAYAFMSFDSPNLPSTIGLDSRLALCSDLVQLLTETGLCENSDEAKIIVSQVATAIGDVPSVLLLRLMLTRNDCAEDARSHCDVISRAIASLDLYTTRINFLLCRIKGVQCRDHELACDLLDQLLGRLALMPDQTFCIDKIVVLRTQIVTAQTDASKDCVAFAESLDGIREAMGGRLHRDSAEACHAVSSHFIFYHGGALIVKQISADLGQNRCPSWKAEAGRRNLLVHRGKP